MSRKDKSRDKSTVKTVKSPSFEDIKPREDEPREEKPREEKPRESKEDEPREEKPREDEPREEKPKPKKKHCKVDAFIDGVSRGKHITVSKVDIIYTMLRTEEDFDNNLKSIMNAIEKRKRGFEVQTICIPEVDPKKKYPRKVALAWNAMGILLTYKVLGLRLPFNKDGFKSLFVEEYNIIGDKLIKLF